MEIKVDGIPNLTKNIEKMMEFRSQIPFAQSRAVNALAFDVRSSTIQLSKDRFNIRKDNTLTNRNTGFLVETGNKRTLQARVYTNTDIWDLHETGGVKKPKGNNLAIPQREQLGVDLKTIIPKGKRPRQLLNRARTFIQTMPSGKTGIWQRIGRGRTPIRLLYAFGKQAVIKKVFGFGQNAEQVVIKNYERKFGEELGKAIATAFKK